MQGRILVVAASALFMMSRALPVRAAAPVCRQETFTETFSDGGNEGGWTIGGNEFIDNQKGKNKDFLHAPQLDTFYPIALTQGASEFTGDFAARGVTAIGAELATIHYRTQDYTFHSPTIVLINAMETPEDPSDDCIVFFQTGRDMPVPDPGRINWVQYTFPIPASSETLPQPNNGDPCPGSFCEVCILPGDPDPTGKPCWGAYKGTNCATMPDVDLTWRTVVGNVDQVYIQWLSPEWFSIFALWDVGFDNPSITTCN